MQYKYSGELMVLWYKVSLCDYIPASIGRDVAASQRRNRYNVQLDFTPLVKILPECNSRGCWHDMIMMLETRRQE